MQLKEIKKGENSIQFVVKEINKKINRFLANKKMVLFFSTGWDGMHCAVSCPAGKWGGNCTAPCECQNGGECHPETGECTCGPGYTGEKCEDVCRQGTYGIHCQ